MAAFAPNIASMNDEWLDDQFPLGDGLAETSALLACPYCGSQVELALDPGGDAVQEYIEDCEVCCRPLMLTVRWDASGTASVEARTEDDG